MRVLIDGHNALGALRIAGETHEEQRNGLLRLVGLRSPRAVVFFDARDAPRGLESPNAQLGVRVVYCRHREADAEILEEVREAEDPHAITVVTNDRELAGIASQLGAKRMRVQDFLGPGEELPDREPPPALRGRWRFEPKDFGLPDEVDLDNPPDLGDEDGD